MSIWVKNVQQNWIITILILVEEIYGTQKTHPRMTSHMSGIKRKQRNIISGVFLLLLLLLLWGVSVFVFTVIFRLLACSSASSAGHWALYCRPCGLLIQIWLRILQWASGLRQDLSDFQCVGRYFVLFHIWLCGWTM